MSSSSNHKRSMEVMGLARELFHGGVLTPERLAGLADYDADFLRELSEDWRRAGSFGGAAADLAKMAPIAGGALALALDHRA